MYDRRSSLVHGLVALTATALSSAAGLAQTAGPAISVNAAAGQHAINRNVYGMAGFGVDPKFQAAAHLPLLRWGGDGVTRYNWQVDSSNAGFDWFFMGGDGNAQPVPGAGADAMVAAGNVTKSQTLLTIPIIPYLNSSSAWSCSFPVSVYGPQQATNPYVFPNGQTCGNSIATSGAQLQDTNILANHIPNTPAIQQAWVQHLTARFGVASAGGVRYYQMDNEPFGWANTHRDVQPTQPTYDTIEALTEQYAAVVKVADPSAAILGPSDFGWGAYVGNGPEVTRHGGLWNAPWYLGKMSAYKAAHHIQLLDYFDEHYYPSGPGDDAWVLRSTRSLWDPTYIDESWIGQYYGAVMLIPRMKAWVAQYDPGIKVAISEYGWGSPATLVGALAEADVLGIFGREGVDLASAWYVPTATQPGAFSFMLYRNVDGTGHGFGATSVQTASLDQGVVSAYGALRSASLLTLVLINKTAGDLVSPVTIAGQTGAASAAAYSYSGVDLAAIHQLPAVAFNAGTANVRVPAMSMNMLVVPLH